MHTIIFVSILLAFSIMPWLLLINNWSKSLPIIFLIAMLSFVFIASASRLLVFCMTKTKIRIEKNKISVARRLIWYPLADVSIKQTAPDECFIHLLAKTREPQWWTAECRIRVQQIQYIVEVACANSYDSVLVAAKHFACKYESALQTELNIKSHL